MLAEIIAKSSPEPLKQNEIVVAMMVGGNDFHAFTTDAAARKWVEDQKPGGKWVHEANEPTQFVYEHKNGDEMFGRIVYMPFN